MILTKKLAIAGFGGHAKVIADTAQTLGWSVTGFDDAPDVININNSPWPLAGPISELILRHNEFDGVVIGIGDNHLRFKLHKEFLTRGCQLETLIHPMSSISQYASIAEGCVMMAGSVVNYGARIDGSCIINTGATVDHDCQLSAGVHISPGANLAGGVIVGERALIGIGAAVLQGIKIGKDSIVGAGAVVVKDVPDGAVVIGVPAYPFTQKRQGSK